VRDGSEILKDGQRSFVRSTVEVFGLNMTCKLFGCYEDSNLYIFPEVTKSCAFHSLGMYVYIDVVRA